MCREHVILGTSLGAVSDSVASTALVVWPFTLLIAWIAGEYAAICRVPKVVTYGITGLLAGGFFYQHDAGVLEILLVLSDAAIGLLLTELGFRFNPKWFLFQPRVAFLSIAETISVFVGVLFLGLAFLELEFDAAAIVASICMATSPAAILLVSRQEQSKGPITNLIINLSASSCIISVVTYHLIIGFSIQQSDVSQYQASFSYFSGMIISVLLGAMIATLLNRLLAPLKINGESLSFAIAIGSFAIATLLHELKLSPILGSLSMGITLRLLGVKLPGVHQDFGSLGKFLTAFLFVFVSSQLVWSSIWSGFFAGLSILTVRGFIKWFMLRLRGSKCDLSARQSSFAGLALMPASSFTACILEQSRSIGLDFLAGFNPVVSFIFLAEIFGPIAVSIAIIKGGEAFKEEN